MVVEERKKLSPKGIPRVFSDRSFASAVVNSALATKIFLVPFVKGKNSPVCFVERRDSFSSQASRRARTRAMEREIDSRRKETKAIQSQLKTMNLDPSEGSR